MSINVKKKGNRGELAFAEWLRSKGIKAYRDSASGGGSANKSDISTDTEFGFEVKTVKKLNLQEAWSQCETACGMNKTVPVLAVHYDGMKKDEWLMVMSNHDWIEYALGTTKETSIFEDPIKKYTVQRAIDSLKAVLKQFEV